MNRNDFQELSRIRLEEAIFLLEGGFFPGAYYLAGYSIECGLKACVAKLTKEYEFPDKQRSIDSHTHGLSSLLALANLRTKLEFDSNIYPDLAVNWALVKDWSVHHRYIHSITEVQATQLVDAITEANVGINDWLQKHW